MAHRLPRKIVEHLENALTAATMVRASFDSVGQGDAVSVTVKTKINEITTDGTLTNFIRYQTRLFRQSWIETPIREVLAWSEDPTPDFDINERDDILSRLSSPFPHPDILGDAHSEIVKLREENKLLRAFEQRIREAVEKAK